MGCICKLNCLDSVTSSDMAHCFRLFVFFTIFLGVFKPTVAIELGWKIENKAKGLLCFTLKM